MPAIGDVIDVQDVPRTPDTALVTSAMETAIVREYTFEELLLSRRLHPEALGPFARLTTEELRCELQDYESFLVDVDRGDYRLVIGFSGTDRQPRKGPTVLYAAPPEGSSSALHAQQWMI